MLGVGVCMFSHLSSEREREREHINYATCGIRSYYYLAFSTRLVCVCTVQHILLDSSCMKSALYFYRLVLLLEVNMHVV